jgi:hypothetical protein
LLNDPLGLQGKNRGGEGRKDEKEEDDYRKKTVGLQRGKYKAPLKKDLRKILLWNGRKRGVRVLE